MKQGQGIATLSVSRLLFLFRGCCTWPIEPPLSSGPPTLARSAASHCASPVRVTMHPTGKVTLTAALESGAPSFPREVVTSAPPSKRDPRRRQWYLSYIFRPFDHIAFATRTAASAAPAEGSTMSRSEAVESKGRSRTVMRASGHSVGAAAKSRRRRDAAQLACRHDERQPSSRTRVDHGGRIA